jgi:tetratricopeptide (TPR) repeat protein
VIYAERSVDANPNNYQAALILADITVQGTREHDLDRDEKLAKADKYANQAIAAVTTAEKPNPQVSDQQWADYKKDMIAQAHDALGMSALDKKDYDKAISELKMAVEDAAHPEPAFQVRLASAYQSGGKNDEAIATAEKVMNDSTVPQQIRSVAQSIRASAVMAKNGGKPATQNAPPQVEINRKQ